MASIAQPAPANIYMGAPVRLTTLRNGALTNAEAQERLARTSYLEPTIDRVAPGVTVFGGDGFLNLTLIEGDDGLVVYDSGEVLEDGERFLKQIRAISNKPIVAILYSHSHYTAGSIALVGSGDGVRIVGHPRLNDNLAAGSTGSTFAETAPLQSARTLQQFNHYVEAQGPNAAAGAKLNFGRGGSLPVNTPVQHGERLCIAGIQMQFFTEHGSDTDDCMTVWLPERGVVLNNFLWPFMPNIYTLRASKFRDPRSWRDGLRTMRDLQPEVVVSTHARALVGRQAVRDALDPVIDMLNLVLDQTLRGILRGLGPDELRSFIRLPPHLRAAPHLADIYGELSHYGPYLFNHALGWFDGDAATINPLPPRQQAERLVQAMGGRDAVLALARSAMQAREHAWALQLANYLFKLDPADRDVRTLKADAMEQMGRVTPAHTVRSWYLTQARALRGEIALPRLAFANVHQLSLTPPAQTLAQFRVRIDPERAATMDVVLAITISDRGARHAWHLRRGVVEFVAQVQDCRRAPDCEIATPFENWLRYFICKRPLDEFLARSSIVDAQHDAVRAFFEGFDFYAAEGNPMIPG